MKVECGADSFFPHGVWISAVEDWGRTKELTETITQWTSIWGQPKLAWLRTEKSPLWVCQVFTKSTFQHSKTGYMAEGREKCLLNHRKLGNTESTEYAATQLTVSLQWTRDLPRLKSWWWATKRKRYFEFPGCLVSSAT